MWELYSTCKIPIALTKGFSHIRSIANEEKMLGRGKASLQGRGHIEESFNNSIEKGCSCGTVSDGESALSACCMNSWALWVLCSKDGEGDAFLMP